MLNPTSSRIEASSRARMLSCAMVVLVASLAPASGVAQTNSASSARADAKPVAVAAYPVEEGFVDAHGVLIYYTALGHGAPLVIVHGGPGASHDYFLPYLLPLVRHNRLIFIDERGSFTGFHDQSTCGAR